MEKYSKIAILSLSIFILMALPTINLYAQGSSYQNAIILSDSTSIKGYVAEEAFIYYRFNLKKAQAATISMKPDSTDQDLYVEDSGRNVIGISGNANAELEECIITSESDSTYYAKVNGSEAGSYTITLKIIGGVQEQAKPIKVIAERPPNKSRRVVTYPTFHWKLEDHRPGIMLSYQLHLSRDPDKLESSIFAQDIGNMYYKSSGLEYETQYYWKVKLFDSETGQMMDESDVMKFTTHFMSWQEVKTNISIDPPPGKALLVNVNCPPDSEIATMQANFAELNTTPIWSYIVLTNLDGMVLWDVSGKLREEVKSTFLFGDSFLIKTIKHDENDNVDYRINKIFYNGKGNLQDADVTVSVDLIDVPPDPLDSPPANLQDIPIDRITLERPESGKTISYGASIAFKWKDSQSDPDTYYSLYVGKSSSELVLRIRHLRNKIYIIHIKKEIEKLLDQDRTLYWCVVAQTYHPETNEVVSQAKSVTDSFKIAPHSSPVLNLTSPPNNARNVVLQPTLHWSITGYTLGSSYRSRLYLSKNPNFSDMGVYCGDYQYYSLPDELEPGTIHYWKVDLIDDVSWEVSNQSDVWQFRTRTPDADSDTGASFENAILLSGTLRLSVTKGKKVYLKFDLAQGEKANISMQPLDNDQDLMIHNKNKEIIGSSGNPEKQLETVEGLVTPSSETFYAVVDGFKAGRFEITLNIIKPTVTSPQGGGTSFDDAIELSGTLKKNVAAGSKAYFKFDLESGQMAMVTMQPQSNDQDLFIYNSSRSIIGSSGNSNTETEKVTDISESGTIYAVVDGYEAGDFTIALSISAAK